MTLTSAVLADLSGIRTWSDLATYLSGIHAQTGKSLTELEKIGKLRAKANLRLRELPTSTVSDALSGRRPIKKDLLESLLAAWDVQAQEQRLVLQAWLRINSAIGQGPAGAGRFDEASPRELGVHPAIADRNATDDMPRYVPRDFDAQLYALIGRGVERGCFVVLMGGSSCGKTRSLYEAIRDTVPDWWLVQPKNAQAIHDHLAMPTDHTVLWLDELHRYLGVDPPLCKADIVALVRAGTIVVGTLWPSEYFARKRIRQSDRRDSYAEDRLLLEFAEVIPVAEALSAEEREEARKLAAEDSRIGTALDASDAGMTQVLAAGPDLVNFWEHAPDPYAKAIISAAADARRLGMQNPLPEKLLAEAMAGYLTPAQRMKPPEQWLNQALPHATSQLHGAVSALTLVAGAQAGKAAGFRVADYLTQHIGRLRRVECIPESLWVAAVTHLDDLDDLRRLASSSLARMRYFYAERALSRLHHVGDAVAVGELVTLLQRQDRMGEAMALVDAWIGEHPGDERMLQVRTDLNHVYSESEHLRQHSGVHFGATDRRWELLAHGIQTKVLRERAADGDTVAADDLADLLAHRGCLDELKQRAEEGHRYSASRLAEVLASLGRHDELSQRANAGDSTAARYLERLQEQDDHSRLDGANLAQLRSAADSGDEEAASELTAMLFDNGDQDGLLAEVNAGTLLAGERYLALLNADPAVDRDRFRHIRAFGLHANGLPRGPGAVE